LTDPSEVGRWQEVIVFNAVLKVVEPFLGAATITVYLSGSVKEVATFAHSNTCRVEWYRPNPHLTDGIRRPDVSLLAHDERLVNIESKNWKVGYKPFSTKMFESHVLNRFQDLPAARNYVVISEWRVERSCAEQIGELMAQAGIECLLTHRKATSDKDVISETRIVGLLTPILQQVLLANGEKVIVIDW
jgi:hypothetical protein